MNSKVLQKLQEQYLYSALLVVTPIKISASTIEDDKRKQTKALREAAEEGYIRLTTEPGDYPHITDKCYLEIGAVEPVLGPRTFEPVDRYKDHSDYTVTKGDIDKCVGVKWDHLALSERKWVLEHREDYNIFRCNATWTPITTKPLTQEDFTYALDVYVSSKAVVAERGQRIYQNRYEYVKGHNLAWGLQKLGLLPDNEEKAVVQASRDDLHFFGGTGIRFSHDPQRWSVELLDNIKAIADKLSSYFQQSQALTALQIKLMENGGWDKFFKDYDELIKRELLKEKDADDKPAASEASAGGSSPG